MMISNQYQNHPNFQGNLLKEGIKIPQKKFNEVAKIYSKKTEGMPDMLLIGNHNNSDYNGQFFHSTHAILNGEDVASIVTGDLKAMFKKFSPKEIAEELANITKRFASKEKEEAMEREIDILEGKIDSINAQIKHVRNPLVAKRLQVVADRMEATLEKKQNELDKLEFDKNEISTDWCL